MAASQDAKGSPSIFRDDMRVRRLLARRQGVDWVLFVVAAIATNLYFEHRPISAIDQTGRRAIYQTLTAVGTALFGLTMTSISILMSNLDKPLGGMPAGMPQRLAVALARPMFGLLRVLGTLMIAALTLLVIDSKTTSEHNTTHVVLVALTFVVAARLLRVIYLFSFIIKARLNG